MNFLNLNQFNFFFIRRCSKEKTPVHAAAIGGNTKILALLIRYGGDLRLHDEEGKSAKEYALLSDNSEEKRKMLKFIEEVREVAMMQTAKSQQFSL